MAGEVTFDGELEPDEDYEALEFAGRLVRRR